MRERTYFAQLCLLQLSFGDSAVCIDTLALPDLAPLRAVMAAPPRSQDAARRAPGPGSAAGRSPARSSALFDTQVAAALIGLPAQVGYGELVRQLLGSEPAQGQTRTDWSRRPLTGAQLAYALDDVRYLPPLRERLTERLQQLGRWGWFEEEMAQLDAAGSFAVDPEQAWRRIKGIAELDPARQRLARALAAWRERRAIASRSAAQLDPARCGAARHRAARAAHAGGTGARSRSCPRASATTAARRSWR